MSLSVETDRCAYILLTRGQRAVVDVEDYDRLSVYKWYLSNSGYAVRDLPHKWKGHTRLDGKHRWVHMHSEIMGICSTQGQGYVTDHINGNRLDNRKVNLRVVTHSQSLANRGKVSRARPYKGVCQLPGGRWRAVLGVGGRKLHLGVFDTALEAAKAYNAAAIRFYGQYARPNLIGG